MKKILLTTCIATAVIFMAADANAETARNSDRDAKNRNHYSTRDYDYQYDERNESYRRHIVTYRQPATVYHQPYYNQPFYNQPYYNGYGYYDKDDHRYSYRDKDHRYYTDYDRNRNGNNNRRYDGNDHRRSNGNDKKKSGSNKR